MRDDEVNGAAGVFEAMRDNFGVDELVAFTDMLPVRLRVIRVSRLADEIEEFGVFGGWAEIEDGHRLEFAGGVAEEFYGSVVDLEAEQGFAIENPGGERIVGEEKTEHRGAIAERVFGAAAFDGEGDVAADGVEKFEIAFVVDFFVLCWIEAGGGYGSWDQFEVVGEMGVGAVESV